MKRFLIVLLPLTGLVLMVAGLLASETPAAAAGPCGTAHDGLDGPEQEFLALLGDWRAVNVTFHTPLEASGALNAAAAWFAQDMVQKGPFGDHIDSLGRGWWQRAADCGYDEYFATGSGEGAYLATSPSDPVFVTPASAIDGMANQNRSESGIRIRVAGDIWPVKCVGVGHYRNAAGTREAWVTVLAQFPAGESCPGSNAAPEETPTNTATPTATATRTASPTPTKTATPQPRFNSVLALIPGTWSLVTLPPGPIDQVLARAYGCYEVVYAFEGGEWRRYSPDVPKYARNLAQSTGSALWIKASDKACGLIQL